MRRDLQAAAAGAIAAAAWIAAEPVIRRLSGGTHRELRLISGLVSPNGGDERLGLAVHVANGAAFGVAFSRLGGYGIGRAVLAAQAENAILWPGMAVADRVHPDVQIRRMAEPPDGSRHDRPGDRGASGVRSRAGRARAAPALNQTPTGCQTVFISTSGSISHRLSPAGIPRTIRLTFPAASRSSSATSPFAPVRSIAFTSA